MSNWRPRPEAGVHAVTLPPSASQISLTMANPKPELFARLQASGALKDAEAIMGETVTSIIERERGAQ